MRPNDARAVGNIVAALIILIISVNLPLSFYRSDEGDAELKKERNKKQTDGCVTLVVDEAVFFRFSFGHFFISVLFIRSDLTC